MTTKITTKIVQGLVEDASDLYTKNLCMYQLDNERRVEVYDDVKRYLGSAFDLMPVLFPGLEDLDSSEDQAQRVKIRETANRIRAKVVQGYKEEASGLYRENDCMLELDEVCRNALYQVVQIHLDSSSEWIPVLFPGLEDKKPETM